MNAFIEKLFGKDWGYNQGSPGSIGGKIKRIRELRGWTQKELGIKCGFSESTADVRIAQYEKGKKVPREKALKDISAALEVNEGVLFDANFASRQLMYHAFFDIEDFHGLHPTLINGKYYLEFDADTSYDYFLKMWSEMREKCMPNSIDSEEVMMAKSEEYDLWRFEYPSNIETEEADHFQKLVELHRQEEKVNIAYTDAFGTAELNKVNIAMENALAKVKVHYKDITLESEVIYLLQDILALGIKIETKPPITKENSELLHIFSFKAEDILSNEAFKPLYATLLCQFETMRNASIDVRQLITSNDKVFYISFYIASKQANYVGNIIRYWDELVFTSTSHVWMPKDEFEARVRDFQVNITGENDMVLTVV
ncbi:helix-turn-helix domain-containing protein [Lachnospiraceae bacterium OttesenSCG-928-J05]|nr:helix-turn-helix domain-containing protein [Lachnospiraceae bacterium OttesenSCG-928-J05]